MTVTNVSSRVIDVPPLREQMGLMFNGQSPTEFQKARLCIICNEEAIIFTDEISLKEYTISTMCQKCQDDTFKARDWNEL